MPSLRLATIALAFVVFTACESSPSPIAGPESVSSGSEAFTAAAGKKGDAVELAQEIDRIDAEMMSMMEETNAALASEGLNYRAAAVDWLGMEMSGRVEFFRDRGNKQMDMHFVPGDARRSWSGAASPGQDNITWAVDQTEDAVPSGEGMSAGAATEAITRAMATWDAQRCSDLYLTQNSDFGIDIGVVAFINGLGGSGFILADVQHAGWGDINFGGGVLGVTFTFTFIDGGEPTDINRDGKADVAFREIYYDPSWYWTNTPELDAGIDVETVAVHETGHGLSQAHFGALFGTYGNMKLHFAPKALMNAGYLGPQRTLLGSDVGGHCSIWGSWPNN